jgi:hypothetical protein
VAGAGAAGGDVRHKPSRRTTVIPRRDSTPIQCPRSPRAPNSVPAPPQMLRRRDHLEGHRLRVWRWEAVTCGGKHRRLFAGGDDGPLLLVAGEMGDLGSELIEGRHRGSCGGEGARAGRDETRRRRQSEMMAAKGIGGWGSRIRGHAFTDRAKSSLRLPWIKTGLHCITQISKRRQNRLELWQFHNSKQKSRQTFRRPTISQI